MDLIKRFGGIVATFALMFGFAVLGFALAQPVLLFVGLLCWWPLLCAVAAWTVRGLRDNYQLVRKDLPNTPNMPQQRRRQPPPVAHEEY